MNEELRKEYTCKFIHLLAVILPTVALLNREMTLRDTPVWVDVLTLLLLTDAGGIAGFCYSAGIPLELSGWKIRRDLQSNSVGKRLWALSALDINIQVMESVTKLDELQQRVETTASAPIRASSAAATLRNRIAVQLYAGQVLQSIAWRKAALTKQRDGELLAGETIKSPARKCGVIYQIRRVMHG